MEFDRVRRASHIPNLTPLIDIVFLLLIFFMLTAHFVRDESITIDLPEAESASNVDKEKVVEVLINDKGAIQLNGEFIGLALLENRLRKELTDRSDKTVRIRGDRQSNLEVTVSVLDAARKAGAEGVDIVTERP